MDNKSELLDLLKDKKIAIYGAGYVGKTFYKALSICGIAQNVECFIVSQTDPSQKGIYGIKIQSITEFKDRDDIVICLAVHETIKKEIIGLLKKKGISKYLWISPYIFELFFGRPIQVGVNLSVDRIVDVCSDRHLAIRYLAIENYFGKNKEGYSIYKKAQGLHFKRETAAKRLDAFINLIESWDENGYLTDSKILIDDRYRLLNGFHRVTLARYFGQKEIAGDIYKSSPHYLEWIGNDILLTKSRLSTAGFTKDELLMIEDAHKRLRINETGRKDGEG